MLHRAIITSYYYEHYDLELPADFVTLSKKEQKKILKELIEAKDTDYTSEVGREINTEVLYEYDTRTIFKAKIY